jgi:hypothetical protein
VLQQSWKGGGGVLGKYFFSGIDIPFLGIVSSLLSIAGRW